MQINDMIAQMGGLGAIAQQLGVSESQAATGAAALTPAILGGFKRQAQMNPAGVGGLEGLVGQLGGSDLLENLVSPQPTAVDRGNNVLGTLFGSKEVSRAVAQDASAKTGLDPSILKKMLPLVAMMVTGYMAKKRMATAAPRQHSRGGLGGLIDKFTGHDDDDDAIGSLLGLIGDRNPLDDAMRMVGKR